MNDVELAYLAGFFDGEGCVYITKKKDKRTPIGYGICVMVQITSTNKENLDQFNKLYNGRFHKKTKKEGQKLVLDLYYSSYNDILNILSHLLPFLRSKKKVSELMIQYCQSRLKNKGSYTKSELEIFDQIKSLIKRGE